MNVWFINRVDNYMTYVKINWPPFRFERKPFVRVTKGLRFLKNVSAQVSLRWPIYLSYQSPLFVNQTFVKRMQGCHVLVHFLSQGSTIVMTIMLY